MAKFKSYRAKDLAGPRYDHSGKCEMSPEDATGLVIRPGRKWKGRPTVIIRFDNGHETTVMESSLKRI